MVGVEWSGDGLGVGWGGIGVGGGWRGGGREGIPGKLALMLRR